MASIAFRLAALRARQSYSDAAYARVVRTAGAVVAAAFCVALAAAVTTDWAGASAFLNRMAAIHTAFGAGLLALLLYAGLSVFAAVAGCVLAVAELLPQLAFGGALIGVLPFAQPAAPATPADPASARASVARPEMQIGLYMGKSYSPDSDVFLKAPDGTDLTLNKVDWKEESFKPSPYYGGRGIDWNSSYPVLGAMVDFTHAKATAIRSQTVSLAGRHKGEDVTGTAPFESIFRKLEFTHGLNFLTLNGVIRSGSLHRRIVPYAGIGFGFMMPHADAWRAGEDKSQMVQEPQLTGVAAQVLGGIEWRVIGDRRSLFTEYKLSYTTNEVDLKDGGTVNADILVHQFNFGVYFTPWRASAAR